VTEDRSVGEPTRASRTEAPTQAVPHAVVAGRYALEALVGRGGSAEVWRATDTALGRTVALKLVTVAADESSKRAGDEARTLARLNHPGLVPVYDAGNDDAGRPWVVMELVEGETLSETLQRGALAPPRAAATGQAVAEALAYVHAQGLVHRDVKPANVLIGTSGRVRLTDFGIARLVDSARVTSTGLMVGTASYLAPEQVVGEPVGPPADVYALGLVVLETLRGEREYAGSTVEVALARLSRPPVVPDWLPPGFGALLLAMTDREPAQRPTAQSAATALAGLVHGEATQVFASSTRAMTTAAPRTTAEPRTTVAPRTTAAPGSAVPRRPVPQRAPARRSYGVAVLIAVLVALLALAVGGIVAAQSGAHHGTGTVNGNVPGPLKSDLQRLQDTVR